MKKTFCKPNDIERDLFIEGIEEEMGVKLKAAEKNDVVNGYYSTREKDGILYVDVVLYDKDEPADYFEGMYNNIPYNHGHRTSLEKVGGDIEEKLNKAHEKLSRKG